MTKIQFQEYNRFDQKSLYLRENILSVSTIPVHVES